ncbi:MAG: hypothetical protein COV32_03130, partial [Candidatus Yonathbacteria bacterium CG10_big_fil_rev_8_21_14_0_10_43_136]
MKLPKIRSKRTLFTAAVGGLVVSPALIFLPSIRAPFQNYSVQTTGNIIISKTEEERSQLPIRLTIPILNVNSVIEDVGVTDGGEMDIPKGPMTTAWFNLGPRPGEEGSAVISGHFGWKNGIPAVFDNLHKLKIGDKIYTYGESGVSTTFVVREIKSYDQNADASNVFGSSDGKAHLNLVTCQGVWNKNLKSYS